MRLEIRRMRLTERLNKRPASDLRGPELVRDGGKGGITQGWVRFGRLYPFYPLNRFQSFFVLFVLFLLYCLLFLLFVFVLFGRTVGSHN